MRLFMFMIVLLVVVGGVGFYRGWFTFTTEHKDGADNKVGLKVEIDKDKIKADAEAASSKVRGIGDSVTSGSKTVEGTLAKVGDGTFTVMEANNNEVVFSMEPSAKVRLRDADSRLASLQAGDHVTVAYHEKDGKNMATSVTADRSK
jgi:hypothetical protein